MIIFGVILLLIAIGCFFAARSQAVRTFRFAHDLELAIPFVPMALLIYMTLQILFILPVFFLNAPAINRLGKALTLSLLVAAPIFYFLPAPIIYERQIPQGFWQPAYQFLFSIDGHFNTFPSLHVTFSFILITFLNRQLNKPYLFCSWFLLICLSVLLTHQHHVADIFGGLILGFATCRLFLKPEPLVLKTVV